MVNLFLANEIKHDMFVYMYSVQILQNNICVFGAVQLHYLCDANNCIAQSKGDAQLSLLQHFYD